MALDEYALGCNWRFHFVGSLALGHGTQSERCQPERAGGFGFCQKAKPWGTTIGGPETLSSITWSCCGFSPVDALGLRDVPGNDLGLCTDLRCSRFGTQYHCWPGWFA